MKTTTNPKLVLKLLVVISIAITAMLPLGLSAKAIYQKGVKPEWKLPVIPAPAGYVPVSVDAAANKESTEWGLPGSNPFTPALELKEKYNESTKKETYQYAYMFSAFATPETVKKLGDSKYNPANVCTVQVLPENVKLKTLEEFKNQVRRLHYTYEAGSEMDHDRDLFVPGALRDRPDQYGMVEAGPVFAIWLSVGGYREYDTEGLSFQAILTSNLYLNGRIILLRMYVTIPGSALKDRSNVSEMEYRLKNYEIEEYKKLMVAWVTAIVLRN